MENITARDKNTLYFSFPFTAQWEYQQIRRRSEEEENVAGIEGLGRQHAAYGGSVIYVTVVHTYLPG